MYDVREGIKMKEMNKKKKWKKISYNNNFCFVKRKKAKHETSTFQICSFKHSSNIQKIGI